MKIEDREKMKGEADFRNKSAISIYNHYVEHLAGDNKGKLESAEKFRSDLSVYNLKDHTIRAGKNCVWDIKNCSGVPLDYNKDTGEIFVDGSDAHTLLIGATGSKKSRLVVMPMIYTLAASKETMIICDPKGEIFKRTSGYLSKEGYNIRVINLREPSKSDGWNMFTVPYRMYINDEIDKACEFINDAAINLIPIEAKDPYWDYSARDVFFGLVFLLFKLSKENCLGEESVNMKNLLHLKEELFFSHDSDDIKRTALWQLAKKDFLIRSRLNGTVICPEKTMACIISTFDQHMSCFSMQPQVIEMLSFSTFDLQKVGFGKDAIYLVVPDEKSTYHKIVNIFIKQIYEILIDNAFKRTLNNRYPVRVNFILDEFSSLPIIPDFPQMVTASRSRNIRFMLIIQSKHQLSQRYKDETDTIMSNCSNWIFLTSREINFLKEISELTGKNGRNEPIISISRLQHLNKERGECLVFNGRKYPYFAKLPDIDEYELKPLEQFNIEVACRGDKQNNHIEQQGFWEKIALEELGHEDSLNSLFGDADSDEKYRQELEKKFDDLFGTN